MIGNIGFPIVVLAALMRGLMNGDGQDSIYVCGAESKESVFARSLSESQLQKLHADSMKIVARVDRVRTHGAKKPEFEQIPDQFAYLNPINMKVRAGKDFGQVSFLLKGCMDEFIHLTVDEDEIVLSYGLGGATHIGREVLWSPNNTIRTK